MIENPRVGGSIPPLATSNHQCFSQLPPLPHTLVDEIWTNSIHGLKVSYTYPMEVKSWRQ